MLVFGDPNEAGTGNFLASVVAVVGGGPGLVILLNHSAQAFMITAEWHASLQGTHLSAQASNPHAHSTHALPFFLFRALAPAGQSLRRRDPH